MEPDYPIPRLEFMLTDSKAKVVLTNKPLYSEFLKSSEKKHEIAVEHVVYLDKPIPKFEHVPKISSSNPEGIIFTNNT